MKQYHRCRTIRCRRCGRNPARDSRAALVRVNRKGVKGKWQCAPGTGCTRFVRNPRTLADVIQSLEALGCSVAHRPLPRGMKTKDVRL